MNDDDRICGNCGTPAAGPAPAASNSQFNANEAIDKAKDKLNTTVDGIKQKNLKSFIPFAIIGVVVLAVAIFLITFLPTRIGYKGMIRKTVKAYATFSDAKTVAKNSSQLMVGDKYDLSDSGDMDDYIDDLEEQFDESKEYHEDDDNDNALGENIKLTKLEFKKTEKLDSKKLKKVKKYVDKLKLKYIDGDDISKVIVVKLKVEVKGSEDKDKDTVKVSAIKEKGKWKLFYGDIYDIAKSAS